MEKQNKELLLKDLCCRLPYGVKLRNQLGRINKLVIGNADLTRLYYNDFGIYSEKNLSLPYLFPLSSMTKEHKMFLKQQNWCIAISTSGTVETTIEGIDWLNKNHFDYRGLIEKGLAIDATNLNIY